MAVPDSHWPIMKFGQDLNKAIPSQIQVVGGVNVQIPSLNKSPFDLSLLSEDQIYDTKTAVQITSITANLNGLTILGYATAGDGGGASYKRVASEPAHAGKIQSLDGAWWELTPDWGVDVRQFGAFGGGVINETPYITNAYAYANLKGCALLVPGGNFSVTSGLVFDGPVRVIGAGVNASVFQAWHTDVITVLHTGQYGSIEDLTIFGKGINQDTGTFGANNPALRITSSLGYFRNLRVWGGAQAIDISGTDNMLENIDSASAYGNANVSITGSNWYIRCKFDHQTAAQTPNSGFPWSARANSTAYVLADTRILSGYLIVCTVAGTSGLGAPTLKNYGINITDGTCTWQLLAPVDYAGVDLIGGAMENRFIQTDLTGAGYTYSIRMRGHASGFVAFTDGVMNALCSLEVGAWFTLRGTALGGTISVIGAFADVMIDGNIAVGAITIGVNANRENFSITNNQLAGGTITVTAGTSNHYTIYGNRRVTVTDGGTGINKYVAGNVA